MHEGRVLQDGTPLSAYPHLFATPAAPAAQHHGEHQQASVPSGGLATAPPVLQVLSRLRGGGGDGGSTGAESRSCYLEMYQGKKPDKVNPTEGLLARCAHAIFLTAPCSLPPKSLEPASAVHTPAPPLPSPPPTHPFPARPARRWTRCQLSGADLSPPCVIDELGCLYNKDALLTALLAKSLPPHLSYISGLRSVTELKLTRKHKANGGGGGGGSAGPSSSGAVKAAVKGLHNPGNEAEFCCPITDLEFNGRCDSWQQRPARGGGGGGKLDGGDCLQVEHKPPEGRPKDDGGLHAQLSRAQCARLAGAAALVVCGRVLSGVRDRMLTCLLATRTLCVAQVQVPGAPPHGARYVGEGHQGAAPGEQPRAWCHASTLPPARSLARSPMLRDGE